MEIFSEFVTSQRADVGIGPYRAPANPYCLANFERKALLPQILNRNYSQICCTVTGGAYPSAHLLRIAEVADVPIVIVHLSTKEALLEVMHARERGQKVYVETCPHYLLLDDSVYYQEDYFASARYICAPPMRKKEDQAVLWKALANGSIQTVSTDHCSFTLKQKDAGRGDFTKIPGGLPGVETRGELLYTAGVAEGRITKEQMCALLSENPARLYGAYPRKGVIAPGSDADIVVYDPEADTVITAQTQLSAAGYTPYEGFKTRGSIAQVYLRGTLAVDHGEMKTGPIGTYIPRHPGSL